jgi:thymidylate kinase
MIVGIFGIQRSGKTTLLEKVSRYLATKGKIVALIKPSLWLRALATSVYQSDGTNLNARQCNQLIAICQEKIEKISPYCDFGLSDCHYAFYDNSRHLFAMYPESIVDCFDVCFYLNTTPTIVLDRMAKTEGEKAHYDYSVSEISAWQQYEIKSLSAALEKRKRRLLIVNESPETEVTKILLSLTNQIQKGAKI